MYSSYKFYRNIKFLVASTYFRHLNQGADSEKSYAYLCTVHQYFKETYTLRHVLYVLSLCTVYVRT